MDGLVYSLIAGAGTTVGASLLYFYKRPGEKILSMMLGFAGGIMLGVSVFELMPEAVAFSSTSITVVGFLLGCGLMYLLDQLIPHSHLSYSVDLFVENPQKLSPTRNPLLRMGYLILFGIALHNFPEGVAIGAGLEVSPELGGKIAVAIGLHNLPEGLAIAGPLKAGGLPMGKIMLLTLLAGFMTPLGTAIGLLAFRISPAMIGGSLAFAAGAMIFIVNDELIPKANDMNSHLAIIGITVGLLLAFVLL